MKGLIAGFTLAAVAACATSSARWPYRGPMFLVTNPTAEDVVVLARDGVGRELVTARIQPNGRHCFRWPFIHAIGYLIAAGRDTLKTEPFEPWSADGWEWSGQFEPVANDTVCAADD
ncbi:MAG: hypothetical protein ACREMN_12455 [Gemmatimonadales bacterium]